MIDGGIIDQVTNKALHEELAATTDPVQRAFLEEKRMFVNGSRMLLVLIFAAIGFLVYRAQQLRDRNGGQRLERA